MVFNIRFLTTFIASYQSIRCVSFLFYRFASPFNQMFLLSWPSGWETGKKIFFSVFSVFSARYIFSVAALPLCGKNVFQNDGWTVIMVKTSIPFASAFVFSPLITRTMRLIISSRRSSRDLPSTKRPALISISSIIAR